jgi:hypothetical protein
MLLVKTCDLSHDSLLMMRPFICSSEQKIMIAYPLSVIGVCVECLIGKQKKPILFKVTEPITVKVRTK